MLGDRRLRDRERSAKLADRGLAGGEALQDRTARRIRQGAEDDAQLIGGRRIDNQLVMHAHI